MNPPTPPADDNTPTAAPAGNDPIELQGTCKFCGKTVREHSKEHEGAWFFSPCRTHLEHEAAKSWLQQVSVDADLCLFCGRHFNEHFQLWSPQVSIGMKSGDVTVHPRGRVIYRLPFFKDCRPPELQSD